MSIRRKTFATIAAVFAVLTAASLVITSVFLVVRARRNETAQAHRRADRALRVLAEVVEALDRTTAHYAIRHDLCHMDSLAASDGDTALDAFIRQDRLDFVFILDARERIVFQRVLDVETDRPRTPPQGLLDFLAPGSVLARHAGPESAVRGILDLPGEAVAVVSRPIVPAGEHAVCGTLVVGRDLDDQELSRLSRLTLQPLTLRRLSDPAVPPAVRGKFQRPDSLAATAVHAVDFSTIGGYGLVRDLFDHPALVVEERATRSYYLQALRDMVFLFLLLAVAGSVAVGLSLWLLDRLVLARTSQLRDFVSKVTSGSDLSMRLYLPGHDELTDLGNAFNRMLEALEFDISTRRSAEEAWRHSENLYRSVYDTAPLALILLNRECVITDWNRTAEAIFGWSRQEALGRNIFEFLVPPEDRTDVKQVAGLLLEGRLPSHHVNRNTTKDGRAILCEWNNSVQRNREGAVTGIVALGMDITERVKAEEAARESLARFMGIVENAPLVAIQGFDRNGLILHWNSASERLYGLTATQAIGRKIQEILTTDEEIRDFDGKLCGVWESGTPLPLREWQVKGAGDRMRTVISSMFPVLKNGRVEEVFCMDVDVTDHRKAEEERRQIEMRMQQTQKLESLGMLAGGIAHDFNNLLMAVLGNADLALGELDPASPACNTIQEIIKGSRRAAELCKQMLAYSGRSRFVIEPLDLAHVVREMSNMLEVAVSKKALLRFNLAEHLPAVEADATQMRQVVMNLVINASEAVGGRSGVVAVSLGAKECDEDYLRGCFLGEKIPPGLYVYLEVADTGTGMDPATLGRVFDPFFTTKTSGRGLGLSSVFGIVRGHRGAIRVQSQTGRGTTFRVLLPASEMAALRTEPETEENEWRGSGTILIVDDEETVRALTRRMVELAGFQVLTASDGIEAVEVFREHASEIACVILDLTMPRMDGAEAFHELRKIKPDARVILSSGYDEQDLANRFKGEGLAAFIEKPYTRGPLLAILRKVLEGR